MDRGPIALFGAIVAVGLGPAMWLGAQFGQAIETPGRPPAVTSEQNPGKHTQDKGGAAGSAPEDSAVVVETKPRADIKPLPAPRSSTTPVAQTSSTSPTPSDEPSTGGPSAEPSASTSSAPTESTSSPTADPTDGTGQPPSPPADSDPGDGTGTGSGGIAAGDGAAVPID